MAAGEAHLAKVLKALEDGVDREVWITDHDLAVLAEMPLQDVRDALNGAVHRGKYLDTLERDGRPGAWSYRLIGPINWETVGSRAGTKNAYVAKHLHKDLLEWAQRRGTRSAFTRQAVMKALKLDANHALTLLSNMTRRGQLVCVEKATSWRLPDDVPLLAPEPPRNVVTPSVHWTTQPVYAQAPTSNPVKASVTTSMSFADALRAAAAEVAAPSKPKRSMNECVDAALEALTDGVVLSGDRLRAVLPVALAFQKAAEDMYRAIHGEA